MDARETGIAGTSNHMKLFNIIAILVSLSAVFSYVNHRFIRLPNTIGLMLIAMLVSLGIIGLGALGFGITAGAQKLIESVDFDETLLHGMLSFLLFAGALHVNLSDLIRQKWVISALATVSVIGSTLMVGFLCWWILGWLGIKIKLVYSLLFGALISPTDPVAVLGVLKVAGVPQSLETKISGESLFNDGIAVVVFMVILNIATGTDAMTATAVFCLLLEEVFGGIGLGLLLGGVSYWMLKSVDNYQVEVLITLALVTGGFALAEVLGVSGPIAIVVAGLLIGNHGRLLAMSEQTREHLDNFWELVDEILNAVLFVLIGLEVLVVSFNFFYITAALMLIPLLLLTRFISVGLPIALLRHFRSFSPHVVKILTWGGLRGGISIALALSLPADYAREAILTITYAVVVFSIFVQGLSLGKLVRASQKQ